MTKQEFIRKCKSLNTKVARNKYEVGTLLIELESMGVDLSAPTNAENSDTIGDAIQCYINYDEYTPNDIWNEMFGGNK